MKLAIIGSRNFIDYNRFKEILEEFLNQENITVSVIISGGAKGTDSLAKQYAIEKNILCEEHLPDWNKFGRSAGFLRNASIVEKADKIIAFWDHKSNGTKDSISKAKKTNKLLKIFNTNEI